MSTERPIPSVAELPQPAITLPISGPRYERPDPELIRRLYEVSSATASAILHKMGVRQTFIQGPVPRWPGAKVVGPAVTLQFMPQREDIASGLAQEGSEKVATSSSPTARSWCRGGWRQPYSS